MAIKKEYIKWGVPILIVAGVYYGQLNTVWMAFGGGLAAGYVLFEY